MSTLNDIRRCSGPRTLTPVGGYVVRRRISFLAVLFLVISTAIVASSGARSVASATRAGAAAGQVTVTIQTPSGVPANVTLTGPRRALFAKPASGTSKTASRQLPAGRYRVRPQAVVFRGVLYQSPSHPTVTVAAGRPVRITVRFSKVPSASSLQATSISTRSISLAWAAPPGATFALRRTAGRRPAASRQAGTAVPVTGRTAVDTGLAAGRQYAYALFTHLRGRLAGPITLLARTSAAPGSKTASFAAPPPTLLPTPADPPRAPAT